MRDVIAGLQPKTMINVCTFLKYLFAFSNLWMVNTFGTVSLQELDTLQSADWSTENHQFYATSWSYLAFVSSSSYLLAIYVFYILYWMVIVIEIYISNGIVEKLAHNLCLFFSLGSRVYFVLFFVEHTHHHLGHWTVWLGWNTACLYHNVLFILSLGITTRNRLYIRTRFL